jgi:multiple sugar transport system permease protein
MGTQSTVQRLEAIELEKERLYAYLFTAPAVLIVVVLTAGPLAWSLFMTFHAWQPTIQPEPEFIGIENYQWLFNQPRFWDAVVNFLYYGVVGTIIEVTLGTALALSLYNYVDNNRLRLALLVLFVMPMMFAPVIVAGIWKFMFTPGGGVVNGLLQLVGMGSVEWLRSRWMGLTSIMIADIWQWTGFPMLIIYSGRSAISDSLYDAARIDGASAWMTFWRITFPQLKNLIVVAVILRFLGMYKLFDKLFVMTRGGPGTATELPTFLTYVLGLKQFQIGRGAALAWLLVVGLVVFMYVFWNVSSEETEVN